MAAKSALERGITSVWQKLLTVVNNALVYLDSRTAEWTHWCGNLQDLIDAGALNVCDISSGRVSTGLDFHRYLVLTFKSLIERPERKQLRSLAYWVITGDITSERFSEIVRVYYFNFMDYLSFRTKRYRYINYFFDCLHLASKSTILASLIVLMEILHLPTSFRFVISPWPV